MPRALFEKVGTARFISHLDLMRLFQRAFKRAGLPLTHTQGFNPRPSVSIALPLSLGAESHCELLDFDLESPVPLEDIRNRLNAALIDGIRVREVYDNGAKIKYLALLQSRLTLEYDGGIPAGAESAIGQLFARETLVLEKKNRNGVTPAGHHPHDSHSGNLPDFRRGAAAGCTPLLPESVAQSHAAGSCHRKIPSGIGAGLHPGLPGRNLHRRQNRF